LLECGCSSPAAVNNAEAFLPDDGRVVFCSDFCEALEGSDGLIPAMGWPQFRRPDWERPYSMVGTNISQRKCVIWVLFIMA